MEHERRRVRDTRVVLAALLALSMGVNGVLSHGLATRESMTVLVRWCRGRRGPWERPGPGGGTSKTRRGPWR